MEPVVDRAVITRLGQGLAENHFFMSEAMDRTLKVLKEFKGICDKKGVKKIVAIGTAACRTAANAEVFSDRVKEECGFKLQIISGQDEAGYAFFAAGVDFFKKYKQLIVVDIGGGSTEVITGLIRAKKSSPLHVISLPVGSVRYTEEYVHSDPVEPEEFHRLQLAIRNDILDVLDDFYPKDFNPEDYTLIATAGTATTLAAVDKKLKKYQPKRVHGSKLEKENLEKLIEVFAKKKITERQAMPGMEPLRADVILAGALILREILRFFKKDRAVISDRGVRYGVFYKKFV